jgi:hypothetical protein
MDEFEWIGEEVGNEFECIRVSSPMSERDWELFE